MRPDFHDRRLGTVGGMSKVQVLANVRVEVEPPRFVSYYRRSTEDIARELEGWAREFEAFIRDHRSQDPVYLTVQRDFEDQCSHCKSQWEEDADGPLCCSKAQEEWEAAKEATA